MRYIKETLFPHNCVLCGEKAKFANFLLVTLNDGGIVEKTAACANGWELGFLWRLLPEKYKEKFTRNRVLECTISLMLPGIILRVFRLRIPYKVSTLQNSFRPLLLAWEAGGVKSVSRADMRIARKNTLKTFVPVTPKNSALF